MNLFIYFHAWVVCFLAVSHAQSNSSSSNSSQPDDDDAGWIPAGEYKLPPWGWSSYGNVDEYGSLYFKASGFGVDIVRPGWSWKSNRQDQLVAPFCYDTVPGYMSSCFTGQVEESCQTELQGTPTYENLFCLTNKPHAIVGPVCWNRTCYGEETRQACEEVNGWFVGGESSSFATPDGVVISSQDVGWCVVPGSDHTVFGPACYGLDCYTDELAEACQKLNGTNFADRFCLLDRSYTVVGPVCTPSEGAIEEASECYAEETALVCSEMGGTSVGGIFCILKGEYSVLGPFCSSQSIDTEPGILYPICVSVEEGESACLALSGQSIGNGTFCILEGNDYHLLGPLCNGDGGCWIFDDSKGGGENDCLSKFGGQSVGGSYCILKGDYTIVGPSKYGDIRFTGENVLAKDMDETMIHDVIEGDSSWYVLNGSYSVYGPTCYGSACYDGDCIGAGGSQINSIFCVMAIDDSGSSDAGNSNEASGCGSSDFRLSFFSSYMVGAIASPFFFAFLLC
jgi:hypothetical protein